MPKLKLLVFAVASSIAPFISSTIPAQATQQFDFSFVIPGKGIASGTFTTDDFNASTNSYNITGLTGTEIIGGQPEKITLLPVGDQGFGVFGPADPSKVPPVGDPSPGGFIFWDNRLLGINGSGLSGLGFSFATPVSPGGIENVFDLSGCGELNCSDPGAGEYRLAVGTLDSITNNGIEISNYSVVPHAAGVPEPDGTAGLLVSGLFGLGVAAIRRKRSLASSIKA
jgi:hypothetical protein